MYTGDFSVNPTRLTPGASLPASPEPCDLLFSETTYGARDSGPREDQELLGEVAQVISGQGRVLIPSFALGRAQEVIVLLSEAMASGRVPRVPIYLDGLLKQVDDVYLGLPEYIADPSVLLMLRDYEVLKPVVSMEKRLELLFGNEPCIIVASSGMLTGGWSPLYAKDLVSRDDSAIFFVGYLDEDSPGRALKNLASGKVKFDDDEMKVKCKVRAFNLSAHADGQGVVRLDSLYPSKVFFPVHGEQNARHSVGSQVSEQTGCRAVYPYNGQRLDIYPNSQGYELRRNEDDQRAVNFLDSLRSMQNPSGEEIVANLTAYLQQEGMTDRTRAERFMWEVFKNSANYVSTNPWETVAERARYFHACESVLKDNFQGGEKALSTAFERSVSSFLSNLILYGVNPVWTGLVRGIAVGSLEDAESLLVQVWNNFDFRKPTIVEVYQRCKIRVEWPAGNEHEAKFRRIFGQVESSLELLESLRGIDFLIIGDAIVGAVKAKVILVMVFPSAAEAESTRGASWLAEISQSRLMRLAGWVLEADKVRPVVLPMTGIGEEAAVGITDELRGILADAVAPFREKAGEGVFTLFSDIPEALTREGFEVATSPRFLVATHRVSKKRLLVALDQNGERFADYTSEPGCVMRISAFKKAIGRISTVWTPKIRPDLVKDANGLATDVITAYNWHARLPDTDRRKALESSLDAYEYEYLVRVLRFLRDYTFHDKHELSKTVGEDLEWLQREIGPNHSATRLAFEREVLSHCGIAFTKAKFDRVIALAT